MTEVNAARTNFKKVMVQHYEGLGDPADKYGRGIPWWKHIPCAWGDAFPAVYQVKRADFQDKIFEGIAVGEGPATVALVERLKKKRKVAPVEEVNDSRGSNCGASTHAETCRGNSQ